MSPFDLKRSLESIEIMVDTREQPTKRMQARMDVIGLPYSRQKLEYGDYSCRCALPTGEILDFSNKCCIERKMSIDELCNNFCQERERFEKEFVRAMNDGAKVYLLVEDSSWEKIMTGKYKSRMNHNALLASVLAWCARYGVIPIFCKNETSGNLIREILYRELKEYLENMELENDE